MKTIIKFFIMFMSIKGVQELLLDIAEKLAEQTEMEWDDKIIDFFKKQVEKSNP